MIIIIRLRLHNNYIDLDKSNCNNNYIDLEKSVHTTIAVLIPGQTPTELAEKKSV